MKTLIVGGGNIDFDFALAFMREQKFDYVLAADHGMDFLREADWRPDCIVGDFDSARASALEYFRGLGVEIHTFPAQKDFTDMELAIREAIRRGSTEISVLGATGSRLDHVMGSVKNLSLALEAGVPCALVDANNRIRLMDASFIIRRTEQFGKYVSLLAFGEDVTNLTLRGFFYPLDGYTMTCDQAIGISNQIAEEEAAVCFDSGRLLVVESRD